MTILKNIKLTNREAKALSIIKSHVTPITSTELHEITKIDKRTIIEIVARLRFKGVPIVSKLSEQIADIQSLRMKMSE